MAVKSDQTTYSRQPKLRRFAVGLIAIPAILAAIALSQRQPLHEWTLNRKSTADLALIEPQAEADVYTHYLYARRLVAAGQVSDAKAPVERAVKALTDSTPSELTARTLAISGFLAADPGA